MPFTGIAHQNNQTLYGQNNQTVVRFTTTSEAKSDRNRRNRQQIPGISQVYPSFSRYTRKIPGILPISLNWAANQPQTRLRARKMIPRSFVFYHTTSLLIPYHSPGESNGKYHSFTSKWQALDPPSPRVSVSFAGHQWGEGGGCELGARCTGEAGEGGVHSEDCRPRGGFSHRVFTLRVRIGAARG